MKKRIPLFLLLNLLWGVSTNGNAENSAYVSKVFDFVPAPGQFINQLPAHETNDDSAAIIKKVENYIVGGQNGLVSLGSYGGYVVVGFDHTIVNVSGEYDFKVYGNAFYSSNTATKVGGNSEPGIVMVSYDSNKNNLPDDEWYELAGSEYTKKTTIKNYEITYYKPSTETESQTGALADYIYWKDNMGSDGYVSKNAFHQQSYYPQWIKSDSLVFKGILLPDNGVNESSTGNSYFLYAYDWGYADNHLNTSDLSNFKIEWAVDKDGNSVSLPGIDFIKIYTGVLQNDGWLGECSTEVGTVMDLHPNATFSGIESTQINGLYIQNPFQETLSISTPENIEITFYNLSGKQIKTVQIATGNTLLPLNDLLKGIYIAKISSKTDVSVQKIIKTY